MKFKIEKDKMILRATDNNFCTSAREEVAGYSRIDTQCALGFGAGGHYLNI